MTTFTVDQLCAKHSADKEELVKRLQNIVSGYNTGTPMLVDLCESSPETAALKEVLKGAVIFDNEECIELDIESNVYYQYAYSDQPPVEACILPSVNIISV